MEKLEICQVILGGTPVDLMESEAAVERILARVREGGGNPPLGVASVNLDHVHHFGTGGRWSGTLHANPASRVDWLYFLDGAPLVSQSQRITGRRWPRLAGSDLAAPILARAEQLGLRVGFLGGSPPNQRLLARKIAQEHPALQLGGMWSPSREDLASVQESGRIAREIADSGTQILYVGLGKPRQELWIDEYGPSTGATVLLAFGAAVDFLADRVQRAPEWFSQHGLEWGYRLAREPRRLAGRYLVDGPPAYLTLRTGSSAVPAVRTDSLSHAAPAPRTPGRFTGAEGAADAVVVIVTFNSAGCVEGLLETLREETADLRLRVLVADNSSSDGTLDVVRRCHPDVQAFSTGGNLGYSGGINAAMLRAGDAATVVVLNPDLTVAPGSIRTLMHRLNASQAGAVVPRLVNEWGVASRSLFREPSIATAVGDALLGRRAPNRPGWLAGTDYSPESYAHPHPVDWATGAALMVRRSLADALPWDESYFLYSEETDFFRSLRTMGETVWYEPEAVMRHTGGASGSSPELNALLSVNRVRYIRKYHSGAYAAVFRGAVVLSEVLRLWKPDRRGVLRTVLNEGSWTALPGPGKSAGEDADAGAFPHGSVIIPAHNEAAVIARTLAPLARLAAKDQLEVIVACNGCGDETAAIAGRFEGVKVLELEQPSKTAALNAGDAIASHWPRLYLDADVQISAGTVRAVLNTLLSGRILAARPAARLDLQDAHPLIHSYYCTRLNLPATQTGLWGGGVYGLSKEGRGRFLKFPELTADDLFVDRLFEPAEKAVLDVEPVVICPPKTPKDQVAVLHRIYRGNAEQGRSHSTAAQTLAQVVRTIRGPFSAVNASVYLGFALAGRRLAAHPAVWERDASSRQAGAAGAAG
ncbi:MULTISPECIES: WecB/TagA/CpsF family glycosyltransferase [Micrococcaceae]|uniref:WecB/TagA/CpsF family glycosyltransferase n=1 Tax=Micrococcaceae TaxID=1268 RepID=UPI001CFF9B5B|nr:MULTISPECIES: WecB/TagA/CpsF family glycosyltransferase [Micrococcaceae]MCB5283062.1 N-acetylglucosaminyl-diphospho-decaprenol L-rhamnosyltransferase [Arthrobacter sp. ES1]MDJ0352586.1 WecB/TagA/CpsF family glycosyltransferase [Pseudarthrobacter sp. PH31-O2]WGZ79322.1 WecB/TagA/CpsF family glycosyltransferase [Arthrobacter sp. EM1]